MSEGPNVWAVVVAAGSGERFGGRKQFELLGGRPIAAWSVAAARSVAEGVVLVVPPGEAVHPALDVEAVVEGGATRADSVRAGLAAVPSTAEVVVVHDAVRPLASPDLFRAVVEVVCEGADAAVPGVMVADTLKRVRNRAVVDTVPRDGIVAVQTPQAFRAKVLREAHSGKSQATDDAGLVERMGVEVRVVPGDSRNLKVTTPEDLRVAEALTAAASRGEKGRS